MAESGNPVALTIGGVFNGRYRVIKCLASGGMGAVYEVVHIDTQRRRALKVMLPQLVANEALRDRFKQEATIVSQVTSQHIVEITDAGVDSTTGVPFIVMEYLTGQDLESIRRQKGPMKPHQLAELLRQAAMALDRTHAAGIVHRDLKPENLFVTLRDDGTPHLKVLDFGIAKVVTDGMRGGNQTATIGTPSYMAPEQIQSKTEIGAATDVYALAQVAYTMLAGEAYFAQELEESDNAFQLILAVTKGIVEGARARAKRRRGVEISEALDHWFARATALLPSDRYASAGAAAAAFGEAVGGGGGDLRMSLPDGRVSALSASDASIPTGEFISSGGTGPRFSPTPSGSLPLITGIAPRDSAHPTAASVPDAHAASPSGEIRAQQTALAGPADLAGARSRTISVTVSEPAAAKRAMRRWPFVVGAVALIAGGAFTISRIAAPGTPPAPAKSADPQPLLASASGNSAVPSASASANPSGSGSASALPPCAAGMIRVERTTFVMGDDGDESAKPAHKVTVGPFCIDATEVTVARYKECVDQGKCAVRVDTGGSDMDDVRKKMQTPLCNYGHEDRNTHPMNCVSFADAEAYCAFRNARLPTEAEWELAARGPESRPWPWGADAPAGPRLNACGLECRVQFGAGAASWDVLFSEKDGFGGTAPVGNYPDGRSPIGALDMVGNVAEWTSDWFAPYDTSSGEEPKPAPKPTDNPRRVVRGGAFLSYDAALIAPSARAAWPEDKRAATGGMRCASP
ncbi:MAG: bifunctional serine/threonine-protein kinase/formylglycine-generating enzyme family protein [Polyangiaceae bacterium]